jgi:sporulation protein YlmC with PRC-barrel domain
MRTGRSLTDNPVYNSQDGRLLGKVEDLYLDKDLTTVVAIYLGGEGLIKRTPVYIRRRDVILFGVDAVLARENTIVYRGEEIPTAGQWVRLHDLQGRDVDTPGGTKLGRVRDLVLDADAQITGFTLSQIAVEGPIAESKAVARSALVDVGALDGAMTVDLAIAERASVKVDPDALDFSQPRAAGIAPSEPSTPCAAD